ncbi:probable DNA double-strand break repair Rad50 ATPase [Eupeodes corollae]|uniref:probable DNA double-strand break repair Rad50 ATPase n=1 Tax=Eupeodes corollae TaxID=290404 RepID=UPI0024932925|nr:probable DNA double-strand break repair Rad50 ATPase [Eupeodes corollae]
METPSAEEQQFDQKLEVANKAKEAYAQLYKELVENLRLEHFEDIVNILKADSVAFNKEEILRYFKTNLQQDVINSMDKSWATCNIGVNIATLEVLKDKFRHRKDAKWRPTGKTVEEQTLPIRVQKLDAQCSYLRKQVDFQNAKLEELLQQNTMYRNDVEQFKVRRSFIRDQMHRGTSELQNLKNEYEDAIVQILNQD